MPTVTVAWSSAGQLQFSTEPGTTYKVVLQLARSAASDAVGRLMRSIAVSYTDGSESVLEAEWKAGQRSVGDRNIFIAMGAVPLEEAVFLTAQRVSALEEMVDRTLAVLAAPRVNDVAAQVVVCPLRDTWYDDDSCAWQMFGEKHAAIQALSALTNIPAASVIQNGDNVVEFRYTWTIKRTGLNAIISEVQQCAQLIQACPSLRLLQPCACWVIENFEHIRTAFGAEFGPRGPCF